MNGQAAPSQAAAARPAAPGSAPSRRRLHRPRRRHALGPRRPGGRLDDRASPQMNGLDPDAFLLAGTVIKLPTGAPAPARAAEPAPATVVAQASPDPTPVRLTRGRGLEHRRAARRARRASPRRSRWQESGFNNAMVSSANARGVMQVMPGTWDYVQQYLDERPARTRTRRDDNVRAGSLYLGAAAPRHRRRRAPRHRRLLPGPRVGAEDRAAARDRAVRRQRDGAARPLRRLGRGRRRPHARRSAARARRCCAAPGPVHRPRSRTAGCRASRRCWRRSRCARRSSRRR